MNLNRFMGPVLITWAEYNSLPIELRCKIVNRLQRYGKHIRCDLPQAQGVRPVKAKKTKEPQP